MEFLQSIDWMVVVLGAAFCATLYGLYEWKSFQEAAEALFLMAEKAMATLVIDSGPEAMEKVADTLYEMLPLDVRLVLKGVAAVFGTTPEELTKRLCQYVYDEIKARYGYQQTRWRLTASYPEGEGMQ